jgi:hypothetical protein
LTTPSKKDNQSKMVARAVALTGIAAEMGIIIFLAAKGGMWLDQQTGNEKRIYTAIATIAGVGISLWLVLIQLKRLQDK